MSHAVVVRPVTPTDVHAWTPLWDGYNAYYGRADATALPDMITQTTWARFFDADEPVFALVAERQGRLLGLAHYLLHRSTTRIELICYLQDLFTLPSERGRGIGRALIGGVFEQAQRAGIKRVYWQTHTSNAPGRSLYDRMATHAGFIVYARDL